MLKIYPIDMRQDRPSSGTATLSRRESPDTQQMFASCHLRPAMWRCWRGKTLKSLHTETWIRSAKIWTVFRSIARWHDILTGTLSKKMQLNTTQAKMVAPWGWGSLKGKFQNPSDQSIDITAKLLSYLCPFSNRCVSIPETSLCIQSPKIQKASAVPLHLTKVPVILTRRKAANVFP